MKQLLALLVFALAACGQGPTLKIADAQYRPPLGATGVGVGYFSITSQTSDRIIGVSSPQAEKVEIHDAITNNGQSSMKRLETVSLPAGETVTFAPRGMHLMIFAPKPVAAGATFPIQIQLESGRSETIEFHPALM